MMVSTELVELSEHLVSHMELVEVAFAVDHIVVLVMVEELVYSVHSVHTVEVATFVPLEQMLLEPIRVHYSVLAAAEWVVGIVDFVDTVFVEGCMLSE